MSTKGHEGRQRATKALAGAREGFAKDRQGPEKGATKQKDPRRTTKRQKEISTRGSHEGSAKGQRISTKRVHEGHGKGKKIIHEGPRRTKRATKGLEGAREGSAKETKVEGPLRGWRGVERGPPRIAKGRKDFHQAGPRRTGKGKKISTKGHEGRQRATKGLEGAREGFAKGRHEGFPRKGRPKDGKKAKRFPRRATKDGKRQLRGWRRHEEGSAKGSVKGRKRFSTKGIR